MHYLHATEYTHLSGESIHFTTKWQLKWDFPIVL